MTDSIEALILRIVPSDGSTIGNGKVLEGLKRITPTITEADYWATRDAMIDRGVLRKGSGRGGTVYRNGGKPLAVAKSNSGSQGELWSTNDIMTAALDDDGPDQNAYEKSVVGDEVGEDRVPERFAPASRSTTGRTRFEQAFKNIDDILWKEAGCSSELDYTEQASWLLFLKYLDGLEQEKAMEAELEGKSYAFILDKPYRWDEWAAPKNLGGEIDHNRAQTGDDLREFVNSKLFPYLHGFKQRASGPNTIEYKIGEIFAEIKNKISSGYNLRDIIDHIDELRFGSQEEKHELSHLYEAKIKNMGNAGRNGGEYYTPRPLIRAMVKVVDPRLGERIYDGACGSAGFLCEAFDYLKEHKDLTTDTLKTLQERTFYGKEKKSLAYIIAIMNMILHGIEAPNIIHPPVPMMLRQRRRDSLESGAYGR